MLYLIGGASRSGKSLLAQRFARERAISGFSLDYLVTMLQEGVPSLGIHHELPSAQKGELLWPLLWPLLDNIVEEEAAYVIESDALLPWNVRAFSDAYPQQVRACFLGYPHVDPEQKLRDNRTHLDGPNAWVRHLSDEDLRQQIDRMQAYSCFLANECAAARIAFFDVSTDFIGGTSAAWRYLTAASETHGYGPGAHSSAVRMKV